MVADAVIFDFDDTLVETNCIFEEAREKFYLAMAAYGCTDRVALGSFLNEADIRRVLERGYMAKDCFPKALRETYEYFLPRHGGEIDEATARMIENIGWQVYGVRPKYIEGAVEVLTALQGQVRLFLLTQGDSAMQLDRLNLSGLLPFFEDYRIVRNKDTEAYLAFVRDMDIDVKNSWMVGNSLRSDINPSLGIGLQAIHYNKLAWDFEHEEQAGFCHRVENLIEILEVIPL